MGSKFDNWLKGHTRYIKDNCLIDYPHEYMASLHDSCSCIIVKANADMVYEYNRLVSNMITNNSGAGIRTPYKQKARQSHKSSMKSKTTIKRTQSISVTPASKKHVGNKSAVANQMTVNRSKSTINRKLHFADYCGPQIIPLLLLPCNTEITVVHHICDR